MMQSQQRAEPSSQGALELGGPAQGHCVLELLSWAWAELALHISSQLHGQWHYVDTLKLEACV